MPRQTYTATLLRDLQTLAVDRGRTPKDEAEAILQGMGEHRYKVARLLGRMHRLRDAVATANADKPGHDGRLAARAAEYDQLRGEFIAAVGVETGLAFLAEMEATAAEPAAAKEEVVDKDDVAIAAPAVPRRSR